MKLVRFVKSIAWWIEPREFVRAQHPAPFYFGRPQLKIFLGVFVALWVCAEIGRLNPEAVARQLPQWGTLAWTFGAAVVLVYGTPLLNQIAPSNVRLYANFIVVSHGLFHERCHPFVAIASYRFEKPGAGYWVLHLRDVFDERALVAVPTDAAKAEIETAFTRAGVTTSQLPPDIAAARSEAIKECRARMLLTHDAIRKISIATMPWFLGVSFSLIVAVFVLMFLMKRHVISETTVSGVCIAGMVAFFAGIIWMGRAENSAMLKRLGNAKITCPQCAKPILHVSGVYHTKRTHLPTCRSTLACPYCGSSLISGVGEMISR